MQRPDGLSSADMVEYHRALATTHERRIHLNVLTRSGTFVQSMSPVILDGQVSVDSTVDDDGVSRVLTLTVLDPTRSLAFEADGMDDAPLHLKRMLQVGYSVRVPALNRWVTAYPFTGPIERFKREGAIVSLTAYGKETLSQGTAWIPRQYAKGRRKTDVIRAMLAEVGEGRMSIPTLTPTLPARLTVAKMDKWWPKMRALGRSVDRQLFYPGTGVATLRVHPSQVVFDFTPFLLSDPKIEREGSEFHNIFEIVGRVPRGSKTRVRGIATLPYAHPLSPPSLGRGGKPYYQGYYEQNDQFRSTAECTSRALRMRDLHARTTVDFGFECMPVPHLDEDDVIRVSSHREVYQMRMQKFTIPLGIEGAPPMVVGTIRRTTAVRRG